MNVPTVYRAGVRKAVSTSSWSLGRRVGRPWASARTAINPPPPPSLLQLSLTTVVHRPRSTVSYIEHKDFESALRFRSPSVKPGAGKDPEFQIGIFRFFLVQDHHHPPVMTTQDFCMSCHHWVTPCRWKGRGRVVYNEGRTSPRGGV